jgi:hypothetical protein
MAIFFVFRRKSVDKRSMYSARREQIEHKVRAARQRTLAPHGHASKPEEAQAAPGAPAGFATQAPGTTYEPSAYEPPPAAAPAAGRGAPEAPSTSPWDVGPTVAPPPFQAPSAPFEAPSAPFEAPSAPFEAAPAAPPSFEPAPDAPVWTPAPAPQAPAEPLTPARPEMAPAAPAAWSVVGEAKESTISPEPKPKDKKKGKGQEEAPAGSWQLASGNAPGAEQDELEVRPPGQAVAIAQYAVLVVGLVAVLIGVLIILAGSPVK